MREKKNKAEKKKNAGATHVAATGNAEADAEDAGGANAEDMSEVAEEGETGAMAVRAGESKAVTTAVMTVGFRHVIRHIT